MLSIGSLLTDGAHVANCGRDPEGHLVEMVKSLGPQQMKMSEHMSTSSRDLQYILIRQYINTD